MQTMLFVYGLVLLSIAFLSSRRRPDFGYYMLANRNQPKFLIIASMLASTIGGGLTLGTVNRAYNIGFPAFWFVASGAIAHLAQGAFLSEKVRRTEALTLPDLAQRLSNPSVRKLTGFIIVFTWTGIAAGQFLAASKIVTSITGIPALWAVLASASFLVVYTIVGGQKSILRTDFFQFGVLSAAIVIGAVWLYVVRPVSLASLDLHLFTAKFGPIDLAYYLVVVAGSYLICPMMFGRILSTASPREARKASFTSGIGMLVFAFFITSIGLWARASGFSPGAADPFNGLVAAVLPPWIGSLLVLGILAAILSTADTVLLTAAGILEHDVLGSASVRRTQIWVGLVAIFAAIIAVAETDIVDLLLKTYQGYTSGIVPALFIAVVLHGKRKIRPVWLFAAIACGYALGFGGNFAKDPTVQKMLAFAGIIVSAGISLLGLTPGEMQARPAAEAAPEKP